MSLIAASVEGRKRGGRKPCAQGGADHRLGTDVDRPGQLDCLPIAHRKEGRSHQRSEEPGRGQMRGLQPECEQDSHDRQKS